MGGGRGAYEGGGVSEAVGAIRLHSPPPRSVHIHPPPPSQVRALVGAALAVAIRAVADNRAMHKVGEGVWE